MEPSQPAARRLRTGGGALLRALPGISPAFLVVALLACVLVPLPTPVVDLLLSISLAGAVLLLVASLTIARTSQFLSFPALLLLATLYRLALNISTTRLILSQADAGEVIDAFAGFVVRNDLVVGGVIFAIITVIQYLVIARGAERVAEVAARFALDAMPGHQAAIDADLRAGAISAREAAERRSALAERSNFYGAMDGAVRFVKGDAMAGLAIIAINLVGGLAIGVGRMGLGWEQSLGIYGRLTVGDGLMAQIPALLVSLAAGVLVSRVDREGSEPMMQLAWLDPAMLLVPSGLLIGLALVPQMPTLVFLTTAAALVTTALAMSARGATASRAARARGVGPRMEVRRAPLDAAANRRLSRALSELRLQCTENLGIDIPPLVLVFDRDRGPSEARIELQGRLLARVSMRPDDRDASLLVETYRAVMSHAPILLDLETIDRAVERAREYRPAVVQQALTVVSLTDLLGLARSFLRERIPLPPMEALLQVIAEERVFAISEERMRWPEIARRELAEYWVHRVVEGLHRRGDPVWVRPEPAFEDVVLERIIAAEGEWVLAMSRTEREKAWQHLREDPSGAMDEGDVRSPLAVVTTPGARRAFALLVEGSRPHIPVLSTAELERAGYSIPAARWLAPM